MPPKASKKMITMKLYIYIYIFLYIYIYILWAQQHFSKRLKSQPKSQDKPPQRRKCHKHYTAIETSLNPQTTSMICTSFTCGPLALPSLTHTLKDLPLSPMDSREWQVTQYPFCMWSFGPKGSNFTHTFKDLCA